MNTLERAEKTQRSSTVDTEKRKGHIDDGDTGASHIVSEDKVKDVKEIETIDNQLVNGIHAAKDAISRLLANAAALYPKGEPSKLKPVDKDRFVSVVKKYNSLFSTLSSEVDKRVIFKYSSSIKFMLDDLRSRLSILDSKLEAFNVTSGICCDSSHK